jgi:hypothetical protein
MLTELSGLPHAEHMFLANATPVIGGKRKTSLNSCGRWNASAMYDLIALLA